MLLPKDTKNFAIWSIVVAHLEIEGYVITHAHLRHQLAPVSLRPLQHSLNVLPVLQHLIFFFLRELLCTWRRYRNQLLETSKHFAQGFVWCYF